MAVSIDVLGDLPAEVNKNKLIEAAQLASSVVDSSRSGQINIAIVSRQKSRQLNSVYAGNDYPTDVLSFDYDQENSELGDIAICLPIAKQQAKQAGTTISDELMLLSVHGVLHVLGLDHNSRVEQARFEHMQNDIVKKLGYSSRDFKWSP